jgi:sulfotransferase
LGLAPFAIDPDRLNVGVRESDSHYRMKYIHGQAQSIVTPKRHELPPRIQAQIESAYAWYYALYYPQGKSAPITAG